MNKNKKSLLILGILIFSIIGIISYSSFQQFNSEKIVAEKRKEIKPTEQSQKNKQQQKEKVQQEQQELADKIKKYEETYTPILESQKSYKDMTREERTLAVELIDKWDMLNSEFKNKYNDSKQLIETSYIDYKNEKEAIGYDTGITYEQLARTPDKYEGEKVKFSGKVIQVVESSMDTYLRLAVDGDYKNILYVEYFSEITDKRILEDDYVTIKGQSMGLYTYKSTAGKLVTIPHIYISEIKINE